MDAVVVGAGPNGLTAAVELQRHGVDTLLIEANDQIGGAARTEELTLPGFLHDVGSAIYPLGAGSPAFRSYPLEAHDLQWIHSDAPLAHPLDEGRVAFLERDLEACARGLGADSGAWLRYAGPFVRAWDGYLGDLLDTPYQLPSSPLRSLRLAPQALRSTQAIARAFSTDEARALIAGNAAHAGTPIEMPPAAAVGLTLIAGGHTAGWPMPRGGAGQLTGALASYFESLGGTIQTGSPVKDLGDLPARRATVLALTYGQVAKVAGGQLPVRYTNKLTAWRYGPGAFKVDWALDGPIPWTNTEVGRAATVHVGGTLEEIAESERAPYAGRMTERPFVLLAQPSLFDPSRAPEGKHTAWAYCHVPNGWDRDETEAIEAQIERFAPGFRDRILERAVHSPARFEAWDANLVGGDVNGGALTLSQTVGLSRFSVGGWGDAVWRTPVKDLYIGSASTPPGGGVHGMAGYRAAHTALRRSFGLRPTPASV